MATSPMSRLLNQRGDYFRSPVVIKNVAQSRDRPCRFLSSGRHSCLRSVWRSRGRSGKISRPNSCTDPHKSPVKRPPPSIQVHRTLFPINPQCQFPPKFLLNPGQMPALATILARFPSLPHRPPQNLFCPPSRCPSISNSRFPPLGKTRKHHQSPPSNLPFAKRRVPMPRVPLRFQPRQRQRMRPQHARHFRKRFLPRS